MTRLGWSSFAVVAVVAVVAVGGLVHGVAAPKQSAVTSAVNGAPDVVTLPNSTASLSASATGIPGLGAAFTARIPTTTTQVVLASGKGGNDSTSTVTLYSRVPDGSWHPDASWPAHNALHGWTAAHHLDDLRTPIGVFTLTDAGGLDANPGSRMPYIRSAAFTAVGTGFEGESLADVFDYVVAVDYNHVAGSSPLDARRPLGADRGGGIWLHVDHGGPTHGCVSLPKADMAALLKWLTPAAHPVIVMGDAATLAT